MNEVAIIFYRSEECGSGCCSWTEKDEEITFTESELEIIWPNFRDFTNDDMVLPNEIPESFTDKFRVHYYAVVYR